MDSQTDKANKTLSVFSWVDSQHEQIQSTLHAMAKAPSKVMASKCIYLAHQTQKACAQQPIGILAALQLNRHTEFRHIKELFTGVLCELIAKQLGVPASKRLFIVCAALTQDVGMLDLQEVTLDKQPSPLNDGQKRVVSKHPLSSCSILQQSEVKERSWLETIHQHHEQPDGRGYPDGIKTKQICLGAKILRVADAYVAMSRPRGDRPAFVPKEAIKEIFLQREVKFDTLVARTLNIVLGMYPPGLWVNLANNEVGVVSAQGSSPACPIVSVVIDTNSEHLNETVERDTKDHRYTIVETMMAPFHFNLAAVLNGIWPEINE